jgi:hypothetical protein
VARGLIVGPYAFDRVSFGTSFKSASVNLPTTCMFVVLLIEGLRPVSYAKGLYTQGEQISRVERLCLIDRRCVRQSPPHRPEVLLQLPRPTRSLYSTKLAV